MEELSNKSNSENLIQVPHQSFKNKLSKNKWLLFSIVAILLFCTGINIFNFFYNPSYTHFPFFMNSLSFVFLLLFLLFLLQMVIRLAGVIAGLINHTPRLIIQRKFYNVIHSLLYICAIFVVYISSTFLLTGLIPPEKPVIPTIDLGSTIVPPSPIPTPELIPCNKNETEKKCFPGEIQMTTINSMSQQDIEHILSKYGLKVADERFSQTTFTLHDIAPDVDIAPKLKSFATNPIIGTINHGQESYPFNLKNQYIIFTFMPQATIDQIDQFTQSKDVTELNADGKVVNYSPLIIYVDVPKGTEYQWQIILMKQSSDIIGVSLVPST